MPEGSQDFRDTMTDINGKAHFNTVPRDLLQPRVWEKQKALGLAHMPPPFAEMLEQTKTTFVTKINDIASSEAVVKNRLFFVGDALNTLRPHIAQGANQAAYHCRMLEEVMKGDLKPKDWGDEVMQRGQVTTALSTMVGMYGLRKWSTLAWTIMRLLSLLIALKLKGALNRITGRRKVGKHDAETIPQQSGA